METAIIEDGSSSRLPCANNDEKLKDLMFQVKCVKGFQSAIRALCHPDLNPHASARVTASPSPFPKFEIVVFNPTHGDLDMACLHIFPSQAVKFECFAPLTMKPINLNEVAAILEHVNVQDNEIITVFHGHGDDHLSFQLGNDMKLVHKVTFIKDPYDTFKHHITSRSYPSVFEFACVDVSATDFNNSIVPKIVADEFVQMEIKDMVLMFSNLRESCLVSFNIAILRKRCDPGVHRSTMIWRYVQSIIQGCQMAELVQISLLLVPAHSVVLKFSNHQVGELMILYRGAWNLFYGI